MVRQNLTLFKHLIHRQAEKTKHYFQVARKTYQAFVNTHTGELRFAELDKEITSSKDWHPIVIQLRPAEGGAFEVLEKEGKESFDCAVLEAKAYAMLTKTMHILNQLSYHPKQGKNPFWILRHVAQIDMLLSEQEEGEKNLVHNAWHPVDRKRAEKLLLGRPPGTYLFRKSEYASELEDAINENRSHPVTCITLTYRNWEEKISEKTLLFSDGSWMVFNDNVKLKGPWYPTVKALIASFEKELDQPLYTT